MDYSTVCHALVYFHISSFLMICIVGFMYRRYVFLAFRLARSMIGSASSMHHQNNIKSDNYGDRSATSSDSGEEEEDLPPEEEEQEPPSFENTPRKRLQFEFYD